MINDSSNENQFRNVVAQDAVLDTLVRTMRVDQRMGMAMGMSGGASTSWRILMRHPKNFAGILMMGFAGCEFGDLAPHTRIAFLYGNDDFNARHVRRCVPRLEQAGYTVWAVEFVGGHEPGQPELRDPMLDWLLEGARQRV